MLGGIVVISIGSALYLPTRLGAGPRDGLMLGLHQKFGLSIRVARTIVEVSVLVAGYFLGGTVGAGSGSSPTQMELPKSPVSPIRWPVAMAEAFTVVKVG